MAVKYIKFGPVEWRVLEVKGDKTLLISRYGLECKQYHHEEEDVTWENCDLRKWLNEDFLKAAFTPAEQQRIRFSEVVSNDNNWYGTSGGNNTRDRVFCLSLGEAERYFRGDRERKCRPTAFAASHGAYPLNGRNCLWWLRMPGYYQSTAAVINPGGSISLGGQRVSDNIIAVRPAMWVNL